MIKRILFCGDRKWQDRNSIREILCELISQWGDEIAIIHGAAPGADTLAGEIALQFNLVTVAVPAKWDKYGKKAGTIRNQYMLDKCKPDLVVAFHPNLAVSKGTKHMVSIAKKANVPVMYIKDENTVEMINNGNSCLCPKNSDR